MIIETLSTFPYMYDSVMNSSMMRIAQEKGILDFHAYDLRDWTHDRHRTTDDDPYGGGAGLVMKCEPLFEAYDEICARGPLLSGDWRERDAVQSLGSPDSHEQSTGLFGSCGTRFVGAAEAICCARDSTDATRGTRSERRGPLDHQHLAHLGRALRDGPRLIEHDRLHTVRGLQRLC